MDCSLEMEEERHYNEMSQHQILPPPCLTGGSHSSHRNRTVSSPVPSGSAGLGQQTTPSTTSRPLSPGINLGNLTTIEKCQLVTREM